MLRPLSELYFRMGNCLLFVTDEMEGKENKVIEYYMKSIDILEASLHEIILVPRTIISKPIQDLQVSDLTDNRNHLEESMMDSDKSKDLKLILKGLYDKVEDTIL